jgi:hypothetical protein
MNTMRKIIRTYSELISLPTFEERYEYLRLDGSVGAETFGFDRYLYQEFLKSKEWRDLRDYVIIRDCGCDLAMSDREIYGKILVHHMNPSTKDDVLKRSRYLLDPEYMVCTAKITHDAIHYGDNGLLITEPIVRSKNDTCPWRQT